MEEISNLSNKIWTTQRSRIKMEKRLKKDNDIIAFLNIWYSIFVTSLSIYLVKYPHENISLVLTILSVSLTVLIVFFGAKNYDNRAKEIKTNYIALGKLYNRIECMKNYDEIELEKINNEYADLLNSSENHTSFDYYSVEVQKQIEKVSKENKMLISVFKENINSYRFWKCILGLLIGSIKRMLTKKGGWEDLKKYLDNKGYNTNILFNECRYITPQGREYVLQGKNIGKYYTIWELS